MTREIENGKVAFEGGQCAGRMDHHGPRNSAMQERHERWAVLPLFVCTLSIESTETRRQCTGNLHGLRVRFANAAVGV